MTSPQRNAAGIARNAAASTDFSAAGHTADTAPSTPLLVCIQQLAADAVMHQDLCLPAAVVGATRATRHLLFLCLLLALCNRSLALQQAHHTTASSNSSA
jgi:hypothetical protein